MKRKPIQPVLRSAYRGIHALHLRSYENYQPVFGGTVAAVGSRDCETRWTAISEVLARRQCKSVIDLGCSEGYYVIQAARMGLKFCVGVDFDLRRIWTCQNQVLLFDLPNAAFLISEVEPELIEAMPRFDAVIFLSVLHHILYENGEDHCRALLKALSRKVEKAMIFEMGQSNEHLERWAAHIPDMGSDPHAWIAEFLRSSGFAGVEKIAEATAYKREINRAIFECTPA